MIVTKSDIISKWLYSLNRDGGITFERLTQLEPFLGIPRGTLGAIALGATIPNDYREQLGYAKLVKVPENMVKKYATRGKSRKPRHRKAVNLDDPKSAARSIVNSDATDEYIEKLAQVLTAYVAPVEGELKY